MFHSPKKLLGGLLFAAVSLPVAAQFGGNEQIDISPRRTGDYDERREEGYCVIRVRVDIEADVMLQGNRISVRWYGGQPSRDEGTECSQPLPGGRNVREFQFKGMDGRGEVRLIQEPSDLNRGRAIVKIRDSKGGSEGYTFRLSWKGTPGGWESGGSGGSWGGGSGGNWGGSGGSGTTRGYGAMRMDGSSTERQFDEMRVNLSGSEFTIELRGRDGSAELRGNYRRSGNRLELDVLDGLNTRANGRGELTMRGNQVDRLTADGTISRSNRRWEVRFSQSNSGSGSGGGSGWGSGGGSGGGSGWGSGGSGWGSNNNLNLNVSVAGRGTFSAVSGRTETVSDARVQIRNGQDATIELSGNNGRASFTGNVTSRRDNEVVVNVNRFAQNDAQGEIRIRFRDSSMRDIDTISVNGRVRNGNSFRGDFRR